MTMTAYEIALKQLPRDRLEAECARLERRNAYLMDRCDRLLLLVNEITDSAETIKWALRHLQEEHAALRKRYRITPEAEAEEA